MLQKSPPLQMKLKTNPPKQQRLGSNHNSRYDTAEGRGKSLHNTELELRPKVRNAWAFLLFASRENMIYNSFKIKISKLAIQNENEFSNEKMESTLDATEHLRM